MKLKKKIPKIVLEFDNLFKKMLDHKDKLSDYRGFRNKLMKIVDKSAKAKEDKT